MAIGAKVAAALVIYGNEAAPFIYFDGCYAAVPINSEVLIELAARTFVPISADPSAPLKIKPVTVAHLRCSLIAARQLCDALDSAIEQIEKVMREGEKKSPSN